MEVLTAELKATHIENARRNGECIAVEFDDVAGVVIPGVDHSERCGRMGIPAQAEYDSGVKANSTPAESRTMFPG